MAKGIMTNKSNGFEAIAHMLRLFTVALMLVAVAIQRDGKLFGNDLASQDKQEPAVVADAVKTAPDGSVTVSTAQIGKKIMGYGGPTPLTIKVKDGVVTDVVAEKNNESPEFFDEAFKHLQKKWIGSRVVDIMEKQPDGVSGATMSSNALIGNMQLALQQVSENTASVSSNAGSPWTFAKIAVLIVTLLGCVLPLFSRFKKYRNLWLAVNVLVLGFFGGTFLSHALFVNWLSNGTNLVASLAVVLMLIAAFVYPFFGKKNYYCNWICPMGSIQELAGMVNKKNKWKLSQNAVKRLMLFSEILWGTLMLLMLTGVWSAWMDYELFTAFLFHAASPVVVVIAVVFVALSAFVPRPYCRFVCPTGCLFRLSQEGK